MPWVSYKAPPPAAAGTGEHSHAAATASPLHLMGQLPEFAHYVVYLVTSTMEWNEGLNIGYSRATTCAFFTNLVIWKFPYENRLVEISWESYGNLLCEQCLNCTTPLSQKNSFSWWNVHTKYSKMLNIQQQQDCIFTIGQIGSLTSWNVYNIQVVYECAPNSCNSQFKWSVWICCW